MCTNCWKVLCISTIQYEIVPKNRTLKNLAQNNGLFVLLPQTVQEGGGKKKQPKKQNTISRILTRARAHKHTHAFMWLSFSLSLSVSHTRMNWDEKKNTESDGITNILRPMQALPPPQAEFRQQGCTAPVFGKLLSHVLPLHIDGSCPPKKEVVWTRSHVSLIAKERSRCRTFGPSQKRRTPLLDGEIVQPGKYLQVSWRTKRKTEPSVGVWPRRASFTQKSKKKAYKGLYHFIILCYRDEENFEKESVIKK